MADEIQNIGIPSSSQEVRVLGVVRADAPREVTNAAVPSNAQTVLLLEDGLARTRRVSEGAF